MDKMKIALCDDERIVAKYIERELKTLYPDADTDIFLSGKELLDEYNNNGYRFDVLLLDIQMPDFDGFDVARSLNEKKCDGKVIFLTIRSDMVFEAFKVRAFRYLVKPVNEEDLKEAIDSVSRLLYEKEDTKEGAILIQNNGKYIHVRIKDIILAEIYDRKITLECVDGSYEYYGTIKELRDKVGDDFFIPHRSFLINMRYVEGYDARSVKMQGGRKASISKKKYPEFVKTYMNYMRRE